MENICLVYDKDVFWYWKIFVAEQRNSEEILNGIKEICTRFIDKFFRIARGNTGQLNKDCEEVLVSLLDFIPNLRTSTFPLIEFAENIFNNFNGELMELQTQKARNLISDLKTSYKFEDYHERILLSNLKYVDKEREFLKYVFELKEFRAELVKKQFIDNLHYFMPEFNENCRNQIDVKCCNLEEEFIYEVGIMVAMNKRKIEEFFNNLSQRAFCVLSLKNIQVCSEESLADWSNQYCGIFELEEFVLRQVVMLAPSNYLALISTPSLAKSFIVSLTPEGSTKLKSSIEDSDVVIATGSTKENFVMFFNTLRVMVKGFILKNKEFCESKRFSISGGPCRILSAGYLKALDEVFFVNDARIVNCHSFVNKARNISHLEHFGYVKIESSGEFLFFYKDDEINLLDVSLTNIYKEMIVPSHCFVSGKTLILSKFDGNSELNLTRIEISDEYFAPGSTVKDLLVKAKYQLKANFQLSKNLISNMLVNNQYSIERPSVANLEESKRE